MALVVFSVGLLQVALFGCGPDLKETDVETVSVIDGDTLQVQGTRVQLFGIDAPELGQTCHSSGVDRHCGLDAAYELRKMVWLMMTQNHIACHTKSQTSAGNVSICKIGNVDLARRLLENGLVVAKPDPPNGYLKAEQSARAGHLGLWHEQLLMPALWRQQAVEKRDKEGANPQCVILGIITEAGEKLYYGPLDDAYGSMSERSGADMRWFCSDDEAARLGWRHKGIVMPFETD